MLSTHIRAMFAVAAMAGIAGPASAQMGTPEQRIERLERQVQQVQRQVFPRGRPADTAGFATEPAATATSVRTLDERINGLERQLADILRQSEENGFKVRQLETEVARLRTAQETAAQPTEVASTPVGTPAQSATAAAANRVQAPVIAAATPATTLAPEDPGELAYDEGYELWKSGKYDAAINSLRAMASSFPKHRRVSWANNLAGRALLDKGQPRAAAEALLANYRRDPKGERAADSLFYLGQSLMKLGQPGQACKAYSELEAVYGAKMRDELKRLLPPAKSEARCG